MIAVTAFMCISCTGGRSTGIAGSGDTVASCEFARYFDIKGRDTIITMSPGSDGTAGRRDTLVLAKPVSKIICMSSTHVACLSAIGADSLICAVSGVRYISDTTIKRRYSETENCTAPAGNRHPLYDIGYENTIDYERILSLAPDIVTAYSVSGTEPQYISKLRSLGVPVLVLHDHREEHPIARAEYVRLFGAMTGRTEPADSLFGLVRDHYLSRAVPESTAKVKVLINVPYSDAWYVPGKQNYMSRLVADAGGEILGGADGISGSGIISLEQAYSLSAGADVWLNPGHCRSRRELASVHSLFPFFGPLAKGLPIYNNTLKVNSDGGNDFWESGAVRPDLILEDLRNIFSGHSTMPLHYFISLD